MYINIPDGFELVTLTRNDLNYLREVTKNLEEMLADNGITVKANDMIVTFYIPSGCVERPSQELRPEIFQRQTGAYS